MVLTFLSFVISASGIMRSFTELLCVVTSKHRKLWIKSKTYPTVWSWFGKSPFLSSHIIMHIWRQLWHWPLFLWPDSYLTWLVTGKLYKCQTAHISGLFFSFWNNPDSCLSRASLWQSPLFIVINTLNRWWLHLKCIVVWSFYWYL